MEVDPMEVVENASEEEEEQKDKAQLAKEQRKSRLNTAVAIMVALLATFAGICKVKDDNIVQAMQQAQAKSVDTWAWYQAKKIRLQSAQQAIDQFEVMDATGPATAHALLQKKIADYKKQVEKQTSELADVEKQAKEYDADYDHLNIHDDQFDLNDALLALSISLFALTSLTQKRWLFIVALVPTFFGVLFGFAGLFSWSLHSDFFAKLLGT